MAGRDIDPLLKDLSERKQSFRRNVVSMAVELKEVRCRLASKEQSFTRETLTRQARHLVPFIFLVVVFKFRHRGLRMRVINSCLYLENENRICFCFSLSC